MRDEELYYAEYSDITVQEKAALLREFYRRMDRAFALRNRHRGTLGEHGLRLLNHCAVSAAKDIKELNRDYSNRI